MSAAHDRRLFVLVLGMAIFAGCQGTLSSADLADSGRVPALDGGPASDGGPVIDRDSGPPVDAGPVIATDGGPTPIDGGPTDPCATVTCGANSRCEPATRTCVCTEGFLDTAGACVAIPPGDPAGRAATDVCAQWSAGHVERSSDPWTEVAGDMCGAGSMPADAIDDTLRRINMFRWMVGLEPITDDPGQHPNDQACALMMTRNGSLSHAPPMSWTCYSAGGAAGAGSSNLALGVGSPGGAIDLYMDDSGVPSLGHRRWVLNGPLGRVGIGFAGNAQCLGVFDMSGSSDRQWTSWPNPGPIPSEALRGSWSFHSNRIAMGGATVTVVRVGDGMMLPVTVGHPPDGYGPSTVSWDPMGWSPAVGQRYRVTIDGIAGGPITYEVEPVSC